MGKKVELPIVEPIYSTYHNQGYGSAVIYENPSIRNWYLNQVMLLTCTKDFLSGYGSPLVDLDKATWQDNHCIEKQWCSMRFCKGYINYVIREFLDKGYYVCFGGIDDYYIEGKTWYKERHFSHDGMICGYDQENKTYTIYAYDKNWIYRKFITSQKAFNKARTSLNTQGQFGYTCGIKPIDYNVEFRPDLIVKNIKEYLDSSLKKYPKKQDGKVFGIAVHNYIAMYLDKLYDGSIPYERTDKRVFRLIWEHKKAMLERITKMEKVLQLNSKTSDSYEKIVKEADYIRMLYASHHKKRRDSVLPIIKEKLLAMSKKEKRILKNFIKKVEANINNETMELN